MQSYLAFLWNPDDSASAARVVAIESALMAASKPWAVVYKNSGVTVIHHPHCNRFANVHLLANRCGVVLGSLFRRSNSDGTMHSAVVHVDPPESARILQSEGGHLVRNYWGSYFAIVYDASTASANVLRDPTATLACYRTNLDGVQVFFSELDDFQQYIPQPLSVNWAHIAGRLLAGKYWTRDCGLREIEDVPGGEWITFSRQGEKRSVLWHPAHFCLQGPLEDEQKAAQELRASVVSVVHALASQHTDILVKLSGGLDSSIVATCLAQLNTRPHITCMNYYFETDNDDQAIRSFAAGVADENRARLRRVIARADEREFARTVALKCGFELLEIQRRVTNIDLRLLAQAPLTPRPPNYIFFVDEDPVEMECVDNTHATACFSGDAGDTVFYCTLRAIGALDYAYLHPFGSRLLHHIRVTAALSGESTARVLGKVIRHGFLGIKLPPPYEPMRRPHLMRDEAAAAVSPDYFSHPWEEIARALCPGKRNHVSGIAASGLFSTFVRRRERQAPSVRPLASQPVVETCLRIPSYVLLADGISRGLARRAFRDILPPEVARRTVKGLSVGFWTTVVRRNIPFLRERLMDGILVRKGLLDRAKIDRFLVTDQPFLTIGVDQIIDYLQCEAWLGRWM